MLQKAPKQGKGENMLLGQAKALNIGVFYFWVPLNALHVLGLDWSIWFELNLADLQLSQEAKGLPVSFEKQRRQKMSRIFRSMKVVLVFFFLLLTVNADMER